MHTVEHSATELSRDNAEIKKRPLFIKLITTGSAERLVFSVFMNIMTKHDAFYFNVAVF